MPVGVEVVDAEHLTELVLGSAASALGVVLKPCGELLTFHEVAALAA